MARTTQSSPASTRRASPASTRHATTSQRAPDSSARDRHETTVTIPQPIVDIVTAPFAIAGRILPAKKGLPLYVGLGVLAAVEIIEWPVAAGIGIGYAAIRRWGPQGDQAARRGPAVRGSRGGDRSQDAEH